MFNRVCVIIDQVFNASLLGESAYQEILDQRRRDFDAAMAEKKGYDYADKLIRAENEIRDTIRNTKFNKNKDNLPNAKLIKGGKGHSSFVTAKTLYVERTKDREIVVKFSRKDQIVICSDGTWHYKELK